MDAVNRIDQNVVFYGGMEAKGPDPSKVQKWAVNLDKAGTYYVINLDSGVCPGSAHGGGGQAEAGHAVA